MTNVLAINRILPATGIQTDYLARIKSGRSDRALDLFVPPAGWVEPAVGARDLLAFALIEIRPRSSGSGHHGTDVGVSGSSGTETAFHPRYLA